MIAFKPLILGSRFHDIPLVNVNSGKEQEKEDGKQSVKIVVLLRLRV